MPRSKRPRKQGKHGRKMKAMATLRSRQASPEEREKAVERFKKEHYEHAKGRALIGNRIALADRDRIVSTFVKCMFRVEELDTTMNFEDFRLTGSCLGIAGSMTHALGLENECAARLHADIAAGTFNLIRVMRLRNYQEEVPRATIEAVKAGLVAAQELCLWAWDNDRATLENALELDALEPDDALAEQRVAFILGPDRYALLQEWNRLDAKHFKDSKPKWR